MLRIVFFARVKEQLGCSQLELEWDASLNTIDAVQEYLCARENDQWREVLSEPNIICAVNQTVVTDDAAVCDNDEVAFFPPVTGG
jgi:molybdopterin synthase sulfur carrier subunit